MSLKVAQLIELMYMDGCRKLPLRKMAESINLSPTHLCYLFKSVTGDPPSKYFKSIRMQQAATLLSTTFLSVKEIRTKAGFRDESHFLRDFKKSFGMTPSQYRNRFAECVLCANDGENVRLRNNGQ